jgi:8-oxo-dGTP pyrophosphatase MutT (NUDIX family)
MHRQHILELLDEYEEREPDEIEIIDAFREFILEHPDCFERSLKIGHLTASCWLWNHDQSAALFTLHKKLGIWVQLGGHADGNPNLLEVALKEAEEESGLLDIIPLSEEIFHLDIHEIPARLNEPAHLHYDVRFVLQAQTDYPLVLNSESDELKWVSVEDIPDFELEESTLDMFEKLNSVYD